MRYLILTATILSLSACMEPMEPAKLACIDGVLHEETRQGSGIYLPIDRYKEGGVKDGYKPCRTLNPSNNIASNVQKQNT